MLFRDRRDAGRRLGMALLQYKGENPYILAIPRGGVVVGYEVAAALDAPLDIVVPRKLRAPHNPELAIGAVAHDGSIYLDERLARELGVDEEYLLREVEAQKEEIRRRMALYRGDRPFPSLEERCAIVVDDGIATGSTMIVALRAIRGVRPKKLVAAIPVAPPEGVERLRQEADDVVCLATPVLFYAVGQFYEDFRQTEDAEVLDLLERRRHELMHARDGELPEASGW